MRYLISFLFVLCATFVLAQDEPSQIALLEKTDLAKATDAELFDAAAACRRLTVIGTEKSVDILTKLLADQRLASYARTALQNIPGDAAKKSLEQHPAPSKNDSPIDREQLVSNLFSQQILTGKFASENFTTLLKADDKRAFQSVLRVLRLYPDRTLVDVLFKEWSNLDPERQALVLYALADRKDVAPLPDAVYEVVKSGSNSDLRAAAISLVGKFPSEKGLDVLFGLLDAPTADETTSEALVEALATVQSPNMNDRIFALLNDANPQKRAFGVLLVRERHITEARDRLWEMQKENAGMDRLVVLGTFGRIGGQEGFTRLLDLYAKDTTSVSVFAGLSESCKLSADRTAYAKLIGEKLSDPKSQLELYAVLGGSEALKRIAEIARTTDNLEILDLATKCLGEWMDADVAPVLLDLSASLKEEKYKVRTMRGFLRAVRQFDMPRDEKVKLCKQALEIATREEEKKILRDLSTK